ncbi:hypothetical protein FRB93_005986 [Tulasnella sp. JGI-2019a]|nr:hypothetical protein FRB93_005986 [Tulasnella sp. JGI-2019a]
MRPRIGALVPTKPSNGAALLSASLVLSSSLGELGKTSNWALIDAYSTLVCSVIRKAQDRRSSECATLASKVSRISLAVIEQFLSNGLRAEHMNSEQPLSDAALTEDMWNQVTNLTSVLRDINDYLSWLTTRKWYWNSLRRGSIKSAFVTYSTRLDDSFNVISTSEEPDMLRMSEALQEMIKGARNLASWQLTAGPDTSTQDVHSAHSPVDPTAADRARASTSGRVVVARTPSSYKDSTHRARGWLNVWIPDTEEYQATSGSPSLPLFDPTAHSVRDDLAHKLQGKQVDGFMAALALLEGAAAGIRYLRDHQAIDVAILRACTQVPSFTFGSSGQIVLGRGVLTADLPSEEDDGVIPDAWLIDQFWRITMELLYGDLEAISWNNWDSIQTVAPYARPFLCFCSFDCPSFATLGDWFTGLLESLNTKAQNKPLGYPTIRQEMMRLPHIDLDYFHYPDIAFEVAIGDVGYISAGAFVKVHNIREEFPFVIVPSPGYFRPSGDFTSEEFTNGNIRHTFKEPLCVKILRRDQSECCEEPMQLWSYFIQEARNIHQKYCRGHDIGLTDLILVTGSYYNRRFTSYEVQVTPEQTGFPLPDAQFIEYKNAKTGQPWGVWLYEERFYEIHTKVEQQPQRFTFIQLEKGEC